MPTYKFVDVPREQIGFLHGALKCCHLARFNGTPRPPPPPPPPSRADPPQSPGIDPGRRRPDSRGLCAPPPARASRASSRPPPAVSTSPLGSAPLPSPLRLGPPPSPLPSSLSLLQSAPAAASNAARCTNSFSLADSLRSLLNISSRRKGSFFPISEQGAETLALGSSSPSPIPNGGPAAALAEAGVTPRGGRGVKRGGAGGGLRGIRDEIHFLSSRS